jgi:hypothetical protein
MFVGGEGLTDASLFHHHETYAISQTPLLIWAGQKQSQPFGKTGLQSEERLLKRLSSRHFGFAPTGHWQVGAAGHG